MSASKVSPFQVPSPSSPQRVAELLHLSLSGLQLGRQRHAPTFFGIMPRRLRCQHRSLAVNELVIKCTNKTASRSHAYVRLRCKVRLITSCVLLAVWFTLGTGISQVKPGSFVLSPSYSKDVVLGRHRQDENPLFLCQLLLGRDKVEVDADSKPPQPF